MYNLAITVKRNQVELIVSTKFLHHFGGHSPIPRKLRVFLPQFLEVVVIISRLQQFSLSGHAFASNLKGLGEHIGNAQEVIL